ncbi:MAG: flagellar biosynthetic protein FliO [Gammaproteobacteria bacterium]|nr:flagellar biosynthetic protein FliO [Gammaproteobacteria bacterium]
MNAVLIKKLFFMTGLYRGLLFVAGICIPFMLQAEEPAKESPKKLVFSSDPVGVDVILQLVFSMALVIGVIILFAWLMRRAGGFQGKAGGTLRILGGLSLGTREKLVLVKVGDTQLLLGVAPGQVRKLHVLDTPVIQEGSQGSPKDTEREQNEAIGFSARLKTAMGKKS